MSATNTAQLSPAEIYYAVVGPLVADALANNAAVKQFADEFVIQKKPLSATTSGQQFHAEFSSALEAAPQGTQMVLNNMDITVDDLKQEEPAAEAFDTLPMNIIAFRKTEPGDDKNPFNKIPPGIPVGGGWYLPLPFSRPGTVPTVPGLACTLM